MIRRNGAQKWQNVHVTHEAKLDDLIDIDNSAAAGPQPTGLALLRQAARDLDQIAQEAQPQGKRVRALGSGWALTDIAITDGWLINTKLLNGCFDISSRYFEATYPEAKRPYLVVAQCGISVGELNLHLEVTATAGFRRALKTSGIGAGQTIAGAISGNTHGAAVNFGSTPDFVVGLQIVTGSGKSLWLERASYPVLNDEFMAGLEAERIRDDDVFNAALVSFGAFGIITALAIETDPIYQLKFPKVNDIPHDLLKQKLNNFDAHDPVGLYHYEFIFDPYGKKQKAMEAPAVRVEYEPGHTRPTPVWIVRSDKGFALGDKAARLFAALPVMTPAQKTALQFEQYRKKCILSNVRATPGQLFTATISYFEGYTESALGVSITDAAKMMEISTGVIKQMQLPVMSQVRVVHPSQALLAFTCLGPKTVIFEFGLVNDATYAGFEDQLTRALAAAGVRYTFHWSKNSGIDAQRLTDMYGADRVARWRAARKRVFDNDDARMKVFENQHLVRAGLC
ncbi:MAG: FAD-binding protein [Gemmatimonadota bacterium]